MSNPPLTPQQRIEQVLAAAWQRAQPEVQARLRILQQAAEGSGAEAQQAAALAHKLAGSLGMYGFPEGTRLAQQLEQAWSANAPNAAPDAAPDTALCRRLTAELQALLFPAVKDGTREAGA